MLLNKKEILRKYFGYENFRKGQEDIIDNILIGRDVLGIMPTGAGKSVCYQLPALMLDGITIVISPLISLMKDQVEALCSSGIPAGCLNSSLSDSEYRSMLARAYNGELKIIYAAPERLMTQSFLNLAENMDISMITIDEAHCVSQWGQDFRPSYLKIAEFINTLPYRPVISAFTATATSEVSNDITKILKLDSPFTMTTGFDRSNLYFEVQSPKDKFSALLKIVKKYPDKCGIVYCISRKNVEEICERLCRNGISASRYHAGLDDEERRNNQDDFIYDRKNVMVATNAFGMGIDKSNVSYVVHYNMPKNIESYYQEAGRAGRDGSAAECYLLYSPADIRTNKFLIDNNDDSEVDEDIRERVREKDLDRLNDMAYYCRTSECLRKYILKYFGDRYSDFCGNCSNCLSNSESVDITIDSQKILSCIYRMREKNKAYGIKTVIAVLRGSKAEKLISQNLNSLSTYGIMSDCTEKHCRSVIDYLLDNRYITLSNDEYPVLMLNRKSREILFDHKNLEMRRIKRKETDSNGAATFVKEEDAELFSKLRELRKKIADIEGLPAYIVFSDASLRDMCAKKPENNEEFLTVSGVGYMKLEKYGERFMKVIKEVKQSEPVQ